MKIVLQRVSSASVSINGAPPSRIGKGIVLLVGIQPGDNENIADYMAEKAANLRIFDDKNGDLNRSLLETGGECLSVSNFTLYGNCKKGRRPSFIGAARPEHAEPLYGYFVKAFERAGVSRVVTGEFGADMLVDIQNDGPVTLVLDSAEIFPQSK